jgi:hypothetical protein
MLSRFGLLRRRFFDGCSFVGLSAIFECTIRSLDGGGGAAAVIFRCGHAFDRVCARGARGCVLCRRKLRRANDKGLFVCF